MNDLIKLIEEIIGKKARMKYIEKQKDDVRDTMADVSKAEAKLNWNPKVNTNKGLRKYVEGTDLVVRRSE